MPNICYKPSIFRSSHTQWMHSLTFPTQHSKHRLIRKLIHHRIIVVALYIVVSDVMRFPFLTLFCLPCEFPPLTLFASYTVLRVGACDINRFHSEIIILSIATLKGYRYEFPVHRFRSHGCDSMDNDDIITNGLYNLVICQRDQLEIAFTYPKVLDVWIDTLALFSRSHNIP